MSDWNVELPLNKLDRQEGQLEQDNAREVVHRHQKSGTLGDRTFAAEFLEDEDRRGRCRGDGETTQQQRHTARAAEHPQAHGNEPASHPDLCRR